MTSDQVVILAVSVAGFYPVLKVLKWLWRHNVSGPAWSRADEIVTTVVIRELKERDGNGGHNLTDISDKVDALREEMSGVTSKVDTVNVRLEERTQIIRTGSTTPEPIGHYTQDRLHELSTLLTAMAVRLEFVWRVLKERDFPLPDLPTVAKTEQKEE